MKQRKVLIVDDNSNIPNDIILYKSKAGRIRQENEIYREYELIFEYQNSIEDAKEYLRKCKIVDVLVIDYRFNNSQHDSGTGLINYIRENINKHCRIIFYTMHGISAIPHMELYNLANDSIFRIVDKAAIDNKAFVELIYSAAIDCDPVVVSLERFWDEYRELLTNYEYSFMGENYSLDSIIEHIRMDDRLGREITYKLLHKAILSSIDF